MVVHVDKLKHYKRDDMKSWLLLPKKVVPETTTTDNGHDQINSIIVDPKFQVIPAEVSCDEVKQLPDKSHDTINLMFRFRRNSAISARNEVVSDKTTRT